MSNILTTGFSYSVNGFRQYAFAISPSSSPTPPSIVGSPSFYSVNASGATFSTSITVPSGSNRVLFIVATYNYGVATDSITFGGATMTKYYNGYGSLFVTHSIYYLVNPTASTDTILVTLDSNPGTILRTIGAFTTKDTNQITPINNNADIEGADTSTSVTCVPSVNHSLLFSSVSDYGFSGTVVNTTDGGQSELWNSHLGGTTVTTSGSTKQGENVPMTSVSDTLAITENLSITNPILLASVVDTLTITEGPLIGVSFSSGPNSPATTVDNSSSGGTVTWTNPNNAQVSDAVYTTADVSAGQNTYSHYLFATNFGFSIPVGSTVNGILVEVERKRDTGPVADFGAQLLKGGTLVGSDFATGIIFPTTEAYGTYGSSNNLWGTTWTPAQINASDFGFSFMIVNPGAGTTPWIASVDHIRITVYYTTASGPQVFERSSASVVDTLTCTENITVTPPHFPYSPFENENLIITELLTLVLPIKVSVTDALTVTENYHVPDPSILWIWLIVDSLAVSETFITDSFRFTVGRNQIGKLGISL